MTLEPVSHSYEEETIEAKAAWFRTLTIEERLRVLDEFYRLAITLNPKLVGGRDAGPPGASVRVIELPGR